MTQTKTKKPHSRLCGLVYSSELRSRKHSGMRTIMHTFRWRPNGRSRWFATKRKSRRVPAFRV